MGFMDDFNAFTRGVGQKAKGNYDVVAMNAKIASLQKEIREIYLQIGEKYCAIHKVNAEEALAGFVEHIRNLETQIADVQQQIESTKAATAAVSLKAVPTATHEAGTGAGGFCPKCGALLEADALFCIQCGAAIETKEKTEM